MEQNLQLNRCDQQAGTRWVLCFLSTLLLIVLMFPVRDDGLWWLLSRGREAATGNFWPSSSLLHATVSREPDWLGGVVWWAAFQGLGVPGLMLLKILLAGLMTLTVLWTNIANRSPSAQQSILLGAVAILLLIATRDAFDCHPTSLDCVFVALALVLRRSAKQRVTQSLLATVFVLSCLWANVGQYGLLNALILCDVTTGNCRITDARQRVGLHAASLAGMCITPSGPAGVVEVSRRMWPFLFEGDGLLRGTEWCPVWQQSLTMPLIAFGLLVCGGVVSRVFVVDGERKWPTGILWVTWGCCVSALLPVIAVLMTARWLCAANPSESVALPEAGDHQAPTARTSAPVIGAKPWTLWGSLLVLVTGSLACLCGWERRPGWGLDARLELEPISDALNRVSVDGSVWCVGRRAEGAIAWLRPQGLLVEETAERAWLEGRFRDYATLNLDLRRGWRDSQRRVDGTTAGWWLPLIERDVELIVGAAEDAELISALEPTVWKPLLLEGGVIPFARAGDAGVTPQIMLMLRQREFVERGPWMYSVSEARPDCRTDFGELFGLSQDAEPAWRQARTLRAMNLHAAALRVVEATRAVLSDQRLDEERALILIAQTHGEWLATNAISTEKRRALNEVLSRKLSQPIRLMVQHQLSMTAEVAR